jgi:ATP-binding cassette, subfamily F, member 3
MISINNISYFIGSRPIYEDASLHIKPKDKIGLIGANGTGKSTLLKLIVGDYQLTSGTISKAKDCTIGFLNQDLLSYLSDESILTIAMEAFERQNKLQVEINKLLEEMETNHDEKVINKLMRLQEEFAMLDGYSLQSQAEAILEGLGFATASLNRPLKEFSGGWRMRVMLAKILLQKPSLLLLDEPTNHLDLPSIQWLENFLMNYEGAVVIVSHDKYFLDGATNKTVEVYGAKLNAYSGNYTKYMEEKELRNEIQRGAFKNQQQQIKQQERFIERFKAKASKATLVKSREKALDKIERIEDVEDNNVSIDFKFNFKVQSGRNVLSLENVSKSYPGVEIFKNSTSKIERGDKIALIGANGKGKSTLLRIIAGTEPIDGKRETGHNVNFAFFAQHQLEALNIENTVLNEMLQSGSEKTELELRTVLGCFLFSGDEVQKKIKVLSGGEKSRVALAKTLISESNFLLLDEPTNHLDIASVNILIQALQQYEGTFVVISHDRHFVSEVANKIWYIEDYQIKEYPGTYDEYNYWVKNLKLTPATPVIEQKPIVKQEIKKEQPLNNAAKNDLKKIQRTIDEIESKLKMLEAEKSTIELEMTKPDIYSNHNKLAEYNSKLNKVELQIVELNQLWEKNFEEAELLKNAN